MIPLWKAPSLSAGSSGKRVDRLLSNGHIAHDSELRLLVWNSADWSIDSANQV